MRSTYDVGKSTESQVTSNEMLYATSRFAYCWTQFISQSQVDYYIKRLQLVTNLWFRRKNFVVLDNIIIKKKPNWLIFLFFRPNGCRPSDASKEEESGLGLESVEIGTGQSNPESENCRVGFGSQSRRRPWKPFGTRSRFTSWKVQVGWQNS